MQILELDLCGFARLGDQDVESLLLEDLLYLDDDARENELTNSGTTTPMTFERLRIRFWA